MQCPSQPDLELPIVAAIRRIMRAVDLHSRALVEVHGLTGPQVATLQELAKSGPLSASALARALHLSNPTVTGILTRLEARGLVRRGRGEVDRRLVIVAITDAGVDVLRRSPSLLQDRFRRALGGLQTWEQHMMLASLQRIAAMMDAESIDAAPHLVADARAFDADPATASVPTPAPAAPEPFAGPLPS